MIPTEYRLDQVAARLTERLESTRRTYAGDPDGAAKTFARIAEEVVENAISEYSADGFVDRPQRHAAFLRQEILETFLPRYTRLATAMTAREENGYGMGVLYGPVGRVILFVVVVAIGALLLRAPGPWGMKIAPMIPLILGMFVPDLLGWAARRRYRGDLVSLLSDVSNIQDRAGDYDAGPVESLREGEAEELERARRAAAGQHGQKES